MWSCITNESVTLGNEIYLSSPLLYVFQLLCIFFAAFTLSFDQDFGMLLGSQFGSPQ